MFMLVVLQLFSAQHSHADFSERVNLQRCLKALDSAAFSVSRAETDVMSDGMMVSPYVGFLETGDTSQIYFEKGSFTVNKRTGSCGWDASKNLGNHIANRIKEHNDFFLDNLIGKVVPERNIKGKPNTIIGDSLVAKMGAINVCLPVVSGANRAKLETEYARIQEKGVAMGWIKPGSKPGEAPTDAFK